MAIAANYRKHADAMALQLVLQFGRVLKWATSRPTTRILRAIRAARGRAFKARGPIAYPAKTITPEWFKAAKRAARRLAHAVQEACLPIFIME